MLVVVRSESTGRHIAIRIDVDVDIGFVAWFGKSPWVVIVVVTESNRYQELVTVVLES